MTQTGETFLTCNVAKVDASLGLVMGFAIVCKVDGEDYFDLQDEHIPETVMLEAATEFMKGARVQKDMHKTEDGTVVFAFPLTTEVAKALEITTKKTGLLVAIAPSAERLEDFKSGKRTGFSIGGTAIYKPAE